MSHCTNTTICLSVLMCRMCPDLDHFKIRDGQFGAMLQTTACHSAPHFLSSSTRKSGIYPQLRACFQELVTKTTTEGAENKAKLGPPSPKQRHQEFSSWAQSDRPAYELKAPFTENKKRETETKTDRDRHRDTSGVGTSSPPLALQHVSPECPFGLPSAGASGVRSAGMTRSTCPVAPGCSSRTGYIKNPQPLRAHNLITGKKLPLDSSGCYIFKYSVPYYPGAGIMSFGFERPRMSLCYRMGYSTLLPPHLIPCRVHFPLCHPQPRRLWPLTQDCPFILPFL